MKTSPNQQSESKPKWEEELTEYAWYNDMSVPLKMAFKAYLRNTYIPRDQAREVMEVHKTQMANENITSDYKLGYIQGISDIQDELGLTNQDARH